MPVYILSDKPDFPSPESAEEGGLLAIGGDLSRERLLTAYSIGIFHWYSDGLPVLWWSPDPRLLLIPEDLKISRSLKKAIKKNIFEVTMDRAFKEIIMGCATARRRNGKGTWITSDIVDAYIDLYEAGYAHSIESWYRGELAGGLYGVSIGGAFFGESMFTEVSNASKVALLKLSEQLRAWGFRFIDCQVTSGHLLKLGAREFPRPAFLRMLRDALKMPDRRGRWVFSC